MRILSAVVTSNNPLPSKHLAETLKLGFPESQYLFTTGNILKSIDKLRPRASII